MGSCALKPRYAVLQDLQERISIDMSEATAKIKRSTFLTIHGTADTVIPIDDGRQVVASIPGSKLVEVEEADHNFRASDAVRQQMIGAVLAFLADAKAASVI